MDAGIGDEISLEWEDWTEGEEDGHLELGEVDVEGAVEAERRGDGGDDLADETVQVSI